jgi:hypothetical protein
MPDDTIAGRTPPKITSQFILQIPLYESSNRNRRKYIPSVVDVIQAATFTRPPSDWKNEPISIHDKYIHRKIDSARDACLTFTRNEITP